MASLEMNDAGGVFSSSHRAIIYLNEKNYKTYGDTEKISNFAEKDGEV